MGIWQFKGFFVQREVAVLLENDGGIVNNNVYSPFIPSFRARETRVESPTGEKD